MPLLGVLPPKESMQAVGVIVEGVALHPNRELAMSETIIAIDLGRYKCVACVYARATRDGCNQIL